MEDYLDFHGDNPETLKFSVDLVKLMIPHVAVRDKRWKKFPKESYTATGYEAHIHLYNTIRNKLTSLKDAAEKDRKDAEEKAATEKIKEETAARLEAEHKEATERNR